MLTCTQSPHESVTSTTKSTSVKHLPVILTLWLLEEDGGLLVVVVETLRPIYAGESGRDGGVSASFAAPGAVFGAVHSMRAPGA